MQLFTALRFCFLFSILISGVVFAESKTLVSIQQDRDFKYLVAALQKLVDSESEYPHNHFYIARYPASQDYTYMVWVEAKTLWILQFAVNNATAWESTVLYPKPSAKLNLNQDVVPSEKDVGTSNYLVTEAWAQQTVYKTVINGDLVSIDKSQPLAKNPEIRKIR